MLRSNYSSLLFLIRQNISSEIRLLSGAVEQAYEKEDKIEKPVQNLTKLSTRSSTVSEQNDESNYLGIVENEDNNVIRGDYRYNPNDKKQLREQLKEKFEPLIDSNRKSEPKLTMTWFGKVRLDSENVPKYHGQFEKEAADDFVSPKLEDISSQIGQVELNIPEYKNNFVSKSKVLNKFVDEEILSNCSNPVQSSLTINKINFRYAPEFKTKIGIGKNFEFKYKEQEKKYKEDPEKPLLNSIEQQNQSISNKMAQVKLEHFERIVRLPQQLEMSGANYIKKVEKGKLTPHHLAEYELSNKSHSQIKLDSKGFRILRGQVVDFHELSNRQIVELLENNIIFNDCDIVALNKPYGMSIHGSGKSESDSLYSLNEELDIEEEKKANTKSGSVTNPNLKSFLPDIARKLKCAKLYTVHRIDRDTTGILLLAKTQEKARQLSRLFREQAISKRYLCITRGVPDKPQGVIEIPIEMGVVKVNTKNNSINRERMVLCPEPVQEIRAQRRSSRQAKRAVTRYRVLSSDGNAALVEAFPDTGIRHQIRVHFGFGLRCPILGDHKYSHLEKLAPQRLPSDMLMALRVRQSKVRHVPMHLHSYIVVIPKAGLNGHDIIIRAPLPDNFRKNLSSLKLRMP